MATTNAFFTQQSDEIAEAIRENMGSEGIDVRMLPHVVMPAGGATAWEIPALGESESVKAIEGVIVGWHYARVYYSSPKGADKSPPDCSSKDGVTGYGAPGGSCAACPLAKFGSAGRGQACKQRVVIYLLRRDAALPIVINLAPTSVATFKNYLMQLSAKGVAYWSVVTKFTLAKVSSKSGNDYSQAVVSYVSTLVGEDRAAARSYKTTMNESIAAQQQPQLAAPDEPMLVAAAPASTSTIDLDSF